MGVEHMGSQRLCSRWNIPIGIPVGTLGIKDEKALLLVQER